MIHFIINWICEHCICAPRGQLIGIMIHFKRVKTIICSETSFLIPNSNIISIAIISFNFRNKYTWMLHHIWSGNINTICQIILFQLLLFLTYKFHSTCIEQVWQTQWQKVLNKCLVFEILTFLYENNLFYITLISKFNQC